MTLVIVLAGLASLAGGIAGGVIGTLLILDSVVRRAHRHDNEYEHRATAPQPSRAPVARRR